MSLNKSSFLWGVLIILLGCLLLFNNLGITEINIGELISTFWPFLLIIWAIDILTRGPGALKNKGKIISGLILLLLGIAFLGSNLGYYYLDFSKFWGLFWPVVLILIGWSIFQGGLLTEKTNWAVMSGIENKNQSWELSSNSYVALMGGIELDLTSAKIPEGETFLNLTAVMGGIDIKASRDINIQCKGTALLGGIKFFDNEWGGIIASRQYEIVKQNSNKLVTIQCKAVMGGIEIKS